TTAGASASTFASSTRSGSRICACARMLSAARSRLTPNPVVVLRSPFVWHLEVEANGEPDHRPRPPDDRDPGSMAGCSPRTSETADYVLSSGRGLARV